MKENSSFKHSPNFQFLQLLLEEYTQNNFLDSYAFLNLDPRSWNGDLKTLQTASDAVHEFLMAELKLITQSNLDPNLFNTALCQIEEIDTLIQVAIAELADPTSRKVYEEKRAECRTPIKKTPELSRHMRWQILLRMMESSLFSDRSKCLTAQNIVNALKELTVGQEAVVFLVDNNGLVIIHEDQAKELAGFFSQILQASNTGLLCYLRLVSHVELGVFAAGSNFYGLVVGRFS